MRILQLIDSLEPGGAEKMAVNFANAWARSGESSFLIATKNGGKLKDQIDNTVTYKIYNRHKFNAIFVLIQLLFFIKKNKIECIQAHTSSYKWAYYVKKCFPKVKFYWHDHNGNRIHWESNLNEDIINQSKYFDGVFSCNEELNSWALNNLLTKNCHYIPNFSSVDIKEKVTTLKGEKGKRILCIANWREPKNHVFLIKSFHESGIADYGWSLHLVGKKYNDDYEKNITEFISKNDVKEVYSYGQCTDTGYILSQADVGILVSTYEGFPVSLIEYGLAGLLPIVSNVGFMPRLVENNVDGFIIRSNNTTDLISILLKLKSNQFFIDPFNFKHKCLKKYSSEVVLRKIKIIYER